MAEGEGVVSASAHDALMAETPDGLRRYRVVQDVPEWGVVDARTGVVSWHRLRTES